MGYEWQFDVVWRWLPYFMGGVRVTVLIAITCMAGGVIFGLITAMLRVSRVPILSRLATVYTEFFRTTPGYTQLLWIYYLLPFMMGLSPPPFWAAWFAISLNTGAFMAEIFRAGIESIGAGQWEAALALGMNKTQAYRRIILPQAIMRVVPPAASMWVSLFRDSAVVAMVAVPDLFYRARIAAFRIFRPLEIYTVVAFIYIILCLPQARLADYLHHRLRVRE